MPTLVRKVLLGALVPLALLGLWHMASRHSTVVPSIGSVMDVLAHPFREPRTLECASLARGALVSILRVAIGFLLAVFTAVPIGLLIGRNRIFSEIFSPTIALMMVVSPVAWLPVTILVFGLASPATAIYGGDSWAHPILDQLRFAVIAVIWLGAFFPIAVNTAAGAHATRDAHIETVRVLGATHRQVLTKVILPSAAPYIMSGLRLGGGIAWRVIIAAEIFPGTRAGLGYMITQAHAQAAYEYAFAAIVVIALIGIVLDGGLRLATAAVAHWQPKERQ